MSREPLHQELWEAWEGASLAFEACRCEDCRLGEWHSCKNELARRQARDAYFSAKEDSLE